MVTYCAIAVTKQPQDNRFIIHLLLRHLYWWSAALQNKGLVPRVCVWLLTWPYIWTSFSKVRLGFKNRRASSFWGWDLTIKWYFLTSDSPLIFSLAVQVNLCQKLGIFMYWTCNSMYNLSSYCGLVDPRVSASDKDLPVLINLVLFSNYLGRPFLRQN